MKIIAAILLILLIIFVIRTVLPMILGLTFAVVPLIIVIAIVGFAFYGLIKFIKKD